MQTAPTTWVSSSPLSKPCGGFKKADLDWPIYTDSENAIGWVRGRRCKTKLEHLPSNAKLFELIDAAEKDLRSWRGLSAHGNSFRVMKWDTRAWGEIPADFGRK